MPLTLFGTRGSGSAAIEMALRAANVEYEVVRASTWEPGSAINRLRDINPLGQIPTLVLLDGTVLSESAAILISLGLQYQEAGLLPSDPSAHALAIRGLVFIAANCYAAVSISDYPERWTTSIEVQDQQKVREAARAQLHRHWDIFADMTSARSGLSSERPGALEFMTVVVSQWSGTRQHLKLSRPGFYESLLRLEQHPIIAAVLQEHKRTS